MAILLGFIGVVAAIVWLAAVIQVLMLVRLRRDDVSIVSLMFQGYRFFQQDTFKPEGSKIQRRLLLLCVAFFGCVGAMVLVAALTS